MEAIDILIDRYSVLFAALEITGTFFSRIGFNRASLGLACQDRAAVFRNSRKWHDCGSLFAY